MKKYTQSELEAWGTRELIDRILYLQNCIDYTRELKGSVFKK